MIKMVDVVYVIILPKDTFYVDGGFEGQVISDTENVHNAQFFTKELADERSSRLIAFGNKNKVLPLVLTVVPKIEY